MHLWFKALVANKTKTVPAKAQGRRGRKEPVKPLSGLDIDSLLGESKRTTISVDNAIPEFKQTLATAEDDATVETATKQMGAIVRKLIQDSFADLFYGRAAENLRVMREELVNLELPALYNKFLTGLKKSILSGELNGDRREMWFKHIIGGRLSLVTQEESEVSEVTADEAKAVSLYAVSSVRGMGRFANCSLLSLRHNLGHPQNLLNSVLYQQCWVMLGLWLVVRSTGVPLSCKKGDLGIGF